MDGQKADPDAARALLIEQYEQIGRSQEYLELVIAAVLLNYYVTDTQKHRLYRVLCGETEGSPEESLFPIQLTSAIMVLSASSFFQGLSQDALAQMPDDPRVLESLQLNGLVNNIVLLAASIRIYNLFLAEEIARSKTESPSEVTLEETDTNFSIL